MQNSKLRFMSCREVFLFGIKFTDETSATNWASRSIDTYPTLALPETSEELQKNPVDKGYNFLMSLDKDSIDKAVENLGIEAHCSGNYLKSEKCSMNFVKSVSTVTTKPTRTQ